MAIARYNEPESVIAWYMGQIQRGRRRNELDDIEYCAQTE